MICTVRKIACGVVVGGVSMSGKEKNKGFRENKLEIDREGNEIRSTEGENTKTIRTKNGADFYNSDDHEYDKTTEVYTLNTDGELVLTGGNGHANGDRSWDFKIKTNSGYDRSEGSDIDKSSTTITTTGNYFDEWHSNSKFVAGQGIVMSSGELVQIL